MHASLYKPLGFEYFRDNVYYGIVLSKQTHILHVSKASPGNHRKYILKVIFPCINGINSHVEA